MNLELRAPTQYWGLVTVKSGNCENPHDAVQTNVAGDRGTARAQSNATGFRLLAVGRGPYGDLVLSPSVASDLAASGLLPASIGMGTGLALIVAIGAQNAFLLRLGIDGRTTTVAAVALLCAVSDAVLIVAGVLGFGALIERAPAVLLIARIGGAAFLIGYGLLAVRRALRPSALNPAASAPKSLAAVLLTAAALTWLNPHVYLDTVILLGSLASQQDPADRWWWTGGAIAGSFLWFFGLGFGARLLRPLFARPSAWRLLDGLIAVVMLTLGLTLAIGG